MTQTAGLSLLPPSASALEAAVEALTRRLEDVPTPLRALWDPWTCPLEHLPWLAWALSIDAWNADWPEDVKRAVVAQAIPIARRKGSVKSVRDVVTAYGAQIALREWHKVDPPGDPYTFDLVLTVNGQDGEVAGAAFVEEVIQEVVRTKPARAHFTFTQGLSASGGVGLRAAARPAVYRRLQLQEAA